MAPKLPWDCIANWLIDSQICDTETAQKLLRKKSRVRGPALLKIAVPGATQMLATKHLVNQYKSKAREWRSKDQADQARTVDFLEKLETLDEGLQKSINAMYRKLGSDIETDLLDRYMAPDLSEDVEVF